MYDAVLSNKLEAVKELLAQGVSVNTKDAEGHVPLNAAVYHQNSEMVKFILDNGIDPAMLNDGITAPLGFASSFTAFSENQYPNSLKIVELILNKVDDLNINPPLTLSPKTLDLFIKHGLDINKALPSDISPSGETYLKLILDPAPGVMIDGYTPTLDLLQYLHDEGIDLSAFKLAGSEKNLLDYFKEMVPDVSGLSKVTDVGGDHVDAALTHGGVLVDTTTPEDQ